MSDARPITDVTEFVCSACWNGFSRDDPEVVQGSNVVCPHCGDVQSITASGSFPVVDVVRSAPANLYADSEAPEVAVGDAAARSQTARRDQAASASQDDDELPPWSVESTMHDFDVTNRQTDAGEAGFSGVPERTDPDFAEQQDGEPGLATEVEASDGGLPLEWKVKASSGLTYNFHGVDALLRWSSSRELTEMELSVDGEQWCSLVVFANAARQGLSVQRALALARSGDPDLATADLAERPAAPDLFGMEEVDLP